jgi:hypothetical protein
MIPSSWTWSSGIVSAGSRLAKNPLSVWCQRSTLPQV